MRPAAQPHPQSVCSLSLVHPAIAGWSIQQKVVMALRTFGLARRYSNNFIRGFVLACDSWTPTKLPSKVRPCTSTQYELGTGVPDLDARNHSEDIQDYGLQETSFIVVALSNSRRSNSWLVVGRTIQDW